jgi:hypothetical protein
LALTGIGPLIAWRKASVSNLRRQFAGPTATGVVVAVALIALGMRDVYALVAYALCGFVTGTIVQEFYKGIRARQSIHGESVFTGFVRLVARNRRRYGGYIVHAGIVMLFAAFAGLAFRTEHDVTLKTGEAFEARDPYGHQWRLSVRACRRRTVSIGTSSPSVSRCSATASAWACSRARSEATSTRAESALSTDDRSRDSHLGKARHVSRARRRSRSRHG